MMPIDSKLLFPTLLMLAFVMDEKKLYYLVNKHDFVK